MSAQHWACSPASVAGPAETWECFFNKELILWVAQAIRQPEATLPYLFVYGPHADSLPKALSLILSPLPVFTAEEGIPNVEGMKIICPRGKFPADQQQTLLRLTQVAFLQTSQPPYRVKNLVHVLHTSDTLADCPTGIEPMFVDVPTI